MVSRRVELREAICCAWKSGSTKVKSMGERALKLEPFSMFPRPYGKGRQLLSKKIKKRQAAAQCYIQFVNVCTASVSLSRAAANQLD